MILLVDNYDSFTYNVAQALGVLGQELKVVRNDAVSVDGIEALKPDAIVISPGPGTPDDSGITLETIKRFKGKVPLLGVCLGHQAIGQSFGGQVVRGERPVHGKTSEVYHNGKGLFRGVRNPFKAARYHSLVVPEAKVEPPLEVTAYTLDGVVMGISCFEQMIHGVQFHPESIATAQGPMIFRNFIDMHLGGR